MISDELIEEIIYTSLKGKYLNKLQILKIACDVIEKLENSTKYNFSGIDFSITSWGDKAFAETSIEEGKINFDLNNIKIALMRDKYENYISYLSKNIYIISILFHEIEHLREPYKILTNPLDRKLLNYNINYIYYEYDLINPKCKVITNKKIMNFYLKNWDYVPAERIAEIDSKSRLFYSFKKYPGFTRFNEYNYLIFELCNAELLGYNKEKNISSPLVKYMHLIKRTNVLKSISNIDLSKVDVPMVSDPFCKILRYGYPATKNEIEVFEEKFKAK